ncbi:MAG TPA: hypothetical protein VKB12_08550 [Pyrinomonadaceae bacterium]|nr:hypothetical protein [Pyrinomonadaceae bacterium]
MNRPIITETGDPRPQDERPAAPADVREPQEPPHESPLAAQLPPWDLLPAHTLLVRRKPLKK